MTRHSPPALLRFDLPSGEALLRVRPSRRARRVSLSIEAGAGEAGSGIVELVVPRGVSLAQAMRFFETQRRWVAARLADLPQRVLFADGAELPILGVPHRIRRVESGRGTVRRDDGELLVWGRPEHLPRRIRDHLVALARQELGERARTVAQSIGRQARRITVRDTRSRWGSCSSEGNLSFSWRLLFAPEAVLHYVVAHEVAHLVYMSHGPRFWRVVEKLDPEWRRHRAWLAANRAELLRYG
jgi:predicted metal-dependent hydrolase